jgi:putative Ca2+/H+ antiporter (TMEM165/GDT1 family)
MLKLASVFLAVLVAELGDKTQLATLLFASDRNLNPFQVFFAAASALVLSTGVAVVVGHQATRYHAISGYGASQVDCWNRVYRHRLLGDS